MPRKGDTTRGGNLRRVIRGGTYKEKKATASGKGNMEPGGDPDEAGCKKGLFLTKTRGGGEMSTHVAGQQTGPTWC